MSDLPPLPQPYPYLRVGHWGAAALPEGIGTAIDLTRVHVDQAVADGLDCVVVSAAASEASIAPKLLELLTACETTGTPTVLRVEARSDLSSPVAAVVSHLAMETDEFFREGLKLVGPERAFAIQTTVDPVTILTEGREDPEHATVEAAERRRGILAERSPRAQADRFVQFLGLPVEPQPLVTALIVSRHAKNLHYSLENLERQNYERIDPLLVIDPLYEQDAREITADWDISMRIVTANPRSSLADKLNVGLQYAFGDIVAVIEETGMYGRHYLLDQVQALQGSGAHLVGKASWLVWNDKLGEPTVHAAAKQRSFAHTPSLGTITLYRDTARVLGFARHVSSLEGDFADRIRASSGRVYVSHAMGTFLLRRGQTLYDFEGVVLS